jgi:hypothetical protein
MNGIPMNASGKNSRQTDQTKNRIGILPQVQRGSNGHAIACDGVEKPEMPSPQNIPPHPAMIA